MGDHLQRSANNIRVYARVRPFNLKEVKTGSKTTIVCDYSDNVVLLKKPPEKRTGKKADNSYYKLDHIFSPSVQQVRFVLNSKRSSGLSKTSPIYFQIMIKFLI